jgi:hypothetical protein
MLTAAAAAAADEDDKDAFTEVPVKSGKGKGSKPTVVVVGAKQSPPSLSKMDSGSYLPM